MEAAIVMWTLRTLVYELRWRDENGEFQTRHFPGEEWKHAQEEALRLDKDPRRLVTLKRVQTQYADLKSADCWH